MQKHSTHIQKPFLNLATVLSFLSKWDAKLWKLRVIISLELQLEKHPPWKENHDHMFEFYDTISYYNQWNSSLQAPISHANNLIFVLQTDEKIR